MMQYYISIWWLNFHQMQSLQNAPLTTTIQKIVVATIHHTDHFFRLGAQSQPLLLAVFRYFPDTVGAFQKLRMTMTMSQIIVINVQTGKQCWSQVFLVIRINRVWVNQKYLKFVDIFTCFKPFKVLVHTQIVNSGRRLKNYFPVKHF